MSRHQLGSHGPETPSAAHGLPLCTVPTVSAWADPLGFYGCGIDAGAVHWSEFTTADFQNWGWAWCSRVVGVKLQVHSALYCFQPTVGPQADWKPGCGLASPSTDRHP